MRIVVCAAAGLLIGVICLLAHHGAAANYDSSKTFTTLATVTEFRFANPHPQLFFDVTDEHGNVARWGGEIALSPAQLVQGGWGRKRSEASLAPGTIVSITLSPSRKGMDTRIGLIEKIVNASGLLVLGTISLNSAEDPLLKKKLMSKRLMFAAAAVWLPNAFAQDQAPSKPQTAEAVFKNIQVLKGIPVDEFMGTMGLFSAALTVCCGDCHTGAGTSNPKWEDDPPRKQTARRMVRMMNAINKDNFGGRQVVTCWTCHRGTPNPAVTPPIDTIYGEPIIVPPDIVLPASATALAPTVNQIFDKYIQALGGADRLSKLTSYAAKGTSKLFGEDRNDPAEFYAKAPNQIATIVHQREGDLARTFDGREAWNLLPLTVVPEYPLTAGALEGARLDAQLAFPARLQQFFNNWRVGFPATLDGRDVYVVQGTSNAGLVATLYFDKQTGLLTRVIRYARSAVGRVPTQSDYSDYRPVAGVMMPFKWRYGWVSGQEEYTLTEVQPNVSIDAAKFAKPVPRAR